MKLIKDNRSSVKTKAGYILFVLMAASIAITTGAWVSSRIY
ncbi:hypothetical protein [Paenibacillus polymyxa]|nr:hypothetical protein [Paenibacillus polymyxa]